MHLSYGHNSRRPEINLSITSMIHLLIRYSYVSIVIPVAHTQCMSSHVCHHKLCHNNVCRHKVCHHNVCHHMVCHHMAQRNNRYYPLVFTIVFIVQSHPDVHCSGTDVVIRRPCMFLISSSNAYNKEHARIVRSHGTVLII